MIGTITFNPSIDQNILIEKLVMDDTNRAIGLLRSPGGKGVNVSKVVRELGGRTRAFAIVGGWTGEYWERLSADFGIPFWTHKIKGETRMNTVLTHRKSGTQTRISAPGPRVDKKALVQFGRELSRVRPKPHFWAMGGSLAPGMPADTYAQCIFALQKSGTPCVLDADGEALKRGIGAKPFVIKPNEHEIARLLNRRFRDLGGYADAGRQLVREGVRIVIISLGAQGAVFATEKDVFHVTAPSVKVRSKIGAGDSLVGGFLWGLSRRKSLREAAKIGIAASASTVMREAPRLCRRQDVPAFIRDVRIRDL